MVNCTGTICYGSRIGHSSISCINSDKHALASMYWVKQPLEEAGRNYRAVFTLNITFFCLSALSFALATDSLKQMEEAKKGKWTKLREKFSAKIPEEDSK